MKRAGLLAVTAEDHVAVRACDVVQPHHAVARILHGRIQEPTTLSWKRHLSFRFVIVQLLAVS